MDLGKEIPDQVVITAVPELMCSNAITGDRAQLKRCDTFEPLAKAPYFSPSLYSKVTLLSP
jgi:hypothetical protein